MSALNWRGHAARAENLYSIGDAYFAKAKNVLLAGAALKILGLSTWLLIALTPVVVLAITGAGWVVTRWGWFKQVQETAITDAWVIKDVFMVHALCRLLQERGIPINGWEPGKLPVEFTEVLTSMRK